MNLSTFKSTLSQVSEINFMKPNGELVPAHFHVTEIGLTSKHFIDCGGDIHIDKWANIQIWVAEDYDHRLRPQTLINIIDMSEKLFEGEDLEMEVEFQSDTIGKYGLGFENNNFVLQAKATDCLAKVKCDIPVVKPKINLADLTKENGCTPGGGCC